MASDVNNGKIGTRYVYHANLFSAVASMSGSISDLHPEFSSMVLTPNAEPAITELHHHDHFQLMHSVGEASYHTIGANELIQQVGQVSIIPPGKRHLITICKNRVPGGYQSNISMLHALSRINFAPWELMIDWGYLLPWLRGGNEYLILTLSPKDDLRLREITDEIIRLEALLLPEMRNPKSSSLSEYFERILNMSDEYITCIANSFYSSCTQKELSSLSKYRRPLIAVLSYIEDNIAGEITLTEACSISGLKTSRLSQLFRDVIGLTLTDYVNFMRCQKARLLLANTTLLVNKIAAICGFNSTTYFDRVFRNFTGETPEMYRDHTAIEWKEGSLINMSRYELEMYSAE